MAAGVSPAIGVPVAAGVSPDIGVPVAAGVAIEGVPVAGGATGVPVLTGAEVAGGAPVVPPGVPVEVGVFDPVQPTSANRMLAAATVKKVFFTFAPLVSSETYPCGFQAVGLAGQTKSQRLAAGRPAE